jgi:hypothetical protein
MPRLSTIVDDHGIDLVSLFVTVATAAKVRVTTRGTSFTRLENRLMKMIAEIHRRKLTTK